MYRYCFLLLLLTYGGNCDECAIFNFENGLDDFKSEYGICTQIAQRTTWYVGQYSALLIEPPHPSSSTFITGIAGEFSCITSKVFPMTAGGIIEVQYYVDERAAATDSISLIAFQYLENGNDPTIGTYNMNSNIPERGWRVSRFSIVGIGQFNGYISILTVMSASLLILIDSIRYIPPSLDIDDSCDIYQEDISTTFIPTSTYMTTPSRAPPTSTPPPPTLTEETPTPTIEEELTTTPSTTFTPTTTYMTTPSRAPPTSTPPPTSLTEETPTQTIEEELTTTPATTFTPTSTYMTTPSRAPTTTTPPPITLTEETPTPTIEEELTTTPATTFTPTTTYMTTPSTVPTATTPPPTTSSDETSSPSVTSTTTSSTQAPTKRPLIFFIINKINKMFVLNKL